MRAACMRCRDYFHQVLCTAVGDGTTNWALMVYHAWQASQLRLEAAVCTVNAPNSLGQRQCMVL